MAYVTVLWNDDPGGNVEHIAQHGLTPAEFEDVLLASDSRFDTSASTGRRIAFNYTSTGRYIMVAFDEIDETTVYPVTAYEVPEPGA